MFTRIVVTIALTVAAGCASAIRPLTTGPVGQPQSRPSSQPASRPSPRSLIMRGVVYEDLNSNGLRDRAEPPLEGMPVSDGLSILKTPPDGRFEFRVREKTRGSVFVCTPAGWRASKGFYVIADFDSFADSVQPAEIGLVRDPARNTDRFKFVQLTDTHVTQASSNVNTMIDDLEVVNRLSDAPAFIVVTGDLVNSGKEQAQVDAYLRATQDSRCPLYNVVGNHDYGGALRNTENYEKRLGPPYYSFDVGPYHFISKDVISMRKPDGFYERQETWIEEDLRLNGIGKRIVVLQHYLPTIRELDWWAERNAAAIFSGHWHGRRERVYKGILDVNSATFRFGGIDRSPRGFRIIQVDGDKMLCEWRLGGQNHQADIVNPPAGGEVSGLEIPVRAVAYDTAVRVKTVRYRILDAGPSTPADPRPIGQGDLWAEGSWSWAGRWSVPAGTQPGEKRIEIEVTAVDGSTWRREALFTLTADPAPVATAGQAWPFFHNDAGHRGYLPAGPQPPLKMAWATNIGGTIHIASPVIADGKVYAASSFERSLDDCAVTAMDLATGRKLWRAPVDSSVKHSPAVWNGNVLVVTVAGNLCCLDAEGYPRWTASLDRGRDDRWETSFPVTDGKTVYAGRCTGFGAYDLATGKAIWNQPGGADWWPSIYSGPSLGTGVVYQGGPFVRALDPDKGDIRWVNTKMAVSSVAVVPAAVEHNDQGDRLYVFQNQRTLKCLNGRDGEQIWEAAFDKPNAPGAAIVPLGNETGTPAVGDEVVCIGSAQVAQDKETFTSAMHGFDKATGKLRWRFPVGHEIAPTVPYQRESATITSSPAIVGNAVYFGASDGNFYALDVRDGRLLWKYRLGLPIASSPAVSGNAVVLTTWDGTVYAFTAAN